MKTYFSLLKYVRPYKRFMALAILCVMVYTLTMVLSLGAVVPLVNDVLGYGQKNNSFSHEIKTDHKSGPQPSKIRFIKDCKDDLKKYYNKLIERHSKDKKSRMYLLTWLMIAVVIFRFLNGISAFGQSYLMQFIGQKAIRDLRNKIYLHLHSLSLGYFSKQPSGVLVSRITNDVALVQYSLTDGLKNLLVESFIIIIILIIIFYINWGLALVALIVFPLIIYPAVSIGKKIREIFILYYMRLFPV
jgi:ABC-type multidrug transport system fused ATPase/permease subunit